MTKDNKEIDVSYDDVYSGTPIYASPMGGGIVRIPIKKEEELAFRARIAELESTIRMNERIIEELKDKIEEYEKHLKRSYKKLLKKLEMEQEECWE